MGATTEKMDISHTKAITHEYFGARKIDFPQLFHEMMLSVDASDSKMGGAM